MELYLLSQLFLLSFCSLVCAQDAYFRPFILNPFFDETPEIISATYDGYQSIYLTATYLFGKEEKLLRYDLKADKIETIYDLDRWGHKLLDVDVAGKILCYGSGWKGNVVFFDIKTNNFSDKAAKLPYDFAGASVVRYSEKSVLILGGEKHCNEMLEFDSLNFAHGSKTFDENVDFCSGNAIIVQSNVFIFKTESVVKLNLKNFTVETISIEGMGLSKTPQVATDGEYAYLSGHSAASNSNGLGQFHLETHEFRFVPIYDRFEKKGDSFFNPPIPIFVPGDALLMFGGVINGGIENGQQKIAANPHIRFVNLTLFKSFSVVPQTTERANATTTLNPDDPIMARNDDSSFWIWAAVIAVLISMLGIAGIIIRRFRGGKSATDIIAAATDPQEHSKFEMQVPLVHKEGSQPHPVAVSFGVNGQGNDTNFANTMEMKADKQIWKSRQPISLVSTEIIGCGSFATVYKAKAQPNKITQDYFAVKKIPLYHSLKQQQWDISKVLKEAENLSEIAHPNVVKMHKYWIEDPNGQNPEIDQLRFHEWSSTESYSMFLQMEFCDMTLRRWLILHNELEERKDIKNIMKQIVNGIRGIHSKGIIHRDVKPNNIFHCQDGNLWKIGDLGLSTKCPGSTGDMSLVGSVDYRSPEMDSGLNYNSKTDVFSLGLTFLEIIHIFPNDMIKMQLFDAIRQPTEGRTLADIVPFERTEQDPLIELIKNMLEVKPENRLDIFNASFDTLLF